MPGEGQDRRRQGGRLPPRKIRRSAAAPRNKPSRKQARAAAKAAAMRETESERPPSFAIYPLPGEPAAEGEAGNEQSQRPEDPRNEGTRSSQRPAKMPIRVGVTMVQPSAPIIARFCPIERSPSRCQRSRRSRRSLTASSRRSGWSGGSSGGRRCHGPKPVVGSCRRHRRASTGRLRCEESGRSGGSQQDRGAARRCAPPARRRARRRNPASTSDFETTADRRPAPPPASAIAIVSPPRTSSMPPRSGEMVLGAAARRASSPPRRRARSGNRRGRAGCRTRRFRPRPADARHRQPRRRSRAAW